MLPIGPLSTFHCQCQLANTIILRYYSMLKNLMYLVIIIQHFIFELNSLSLSTVNDTNNDGTKVELWQDLIVIPKLMQKINVINSWLCGNTQQGYITCLLVWLQSSRICSTSKGTFEKTSIFFINNSFIINVNY